MLVGTGGGGFSGSSAATSRAGDADIGGFNFAPPVKIPPLAWVALGLVALLLIVKAVR